MAVNPADLSLRQLHYVVAVADCLGFHRAAERCHVSQPTLSAQVKQVEELLEVVIFERDRRRVLITASGEKVVAHARRVLREAADLIGATKELHTAGAGTLRIGILPTIAPYLLPEIVPAARGRFPKLQLIFREDRTATLVADLREGRIDAAVLALEADIGEWAVGRIAKDEFVVALPRGHRLAVGKPIDPGDLHDEVVLLLEDGHCFRSQVLSVCQRATATEGEYRATSLATLAQMVATGAGITLLPQIALAVENRRDQLVMRPFKRPAPHRTLALIWRPQSPFAVTLQGLAASFRSAAMTALGRVDPG